MNNLKSYNQSEELAKKIHNYLLGKNNNNISNSDVLNNNINENELLSYYDGIYVYYNIKSKSFNYKIKTISKYINPETEEEHYSLSLLVSEITEDADIIQMDDNFLDYFPTTYDKIEEVNKVFKNALPNKRHKHHTRIKTRSY